MIQGGGGAPTTAALAGAVPLEPRREATTIGAGAQNLSESTPDVPSGFGPGVYRGEQVAPTISTGGGATTAALAGAVPLESQNVPKIVQDSQAKADVDPEASANPEALLEKDAVENELTSKVAPAPVTSGQDVSGRVAEIATGAAVGATAAVAAAAALATKAKDSVQSGQAQESAKSTAASAQNTASEYAGQAQTAASQASNTAADYATKAQETAAPYLTSARETAARAVGATTATAAATAASAKSALPESVQKSIPGIAGTAEGTGSEPAAPNVPVTVKDSLIAAHEPAEAAVNPTQVSNKAAVERELHNTVLPDQGIDEPAGSGVPPAVTSSIAAAHVSPEAAASQAAVAEKAQVEEELLAHVKPVTSSGTPAPALAAATSATAPEPTGLTAPATSTTTSEPTGLNAPATAATTTTAALRPAISREVSPMTRPDDQTEPIVTTGVTSGTTSTTTGAAPSATSPNSPVAPGVTGASATKTAGVRAPAVAAAQEAARNPPQVAPGSPASFRTDDSATSKSSKRRSFFGRIKDKVTSKKGEKGERGESSQQ